MSNVTGWKRNIIFVVISTFEMLVISLLWPENSQMANARFQAATAIRDAAIREWSFLSSEEKKSLIRYFYNLIVIICIQYQWDLSLECHH